jgi:diketogulonate reductase-like aldo/keto reductase
MSIAQLTLNNGAVMPALGLGTWRMGESAKTRQQEIATLRHGLDRGIALLDTAEMYGDGGAEEVVGAAIRGVRDSVFLVSKVYPWNASRKGTIAACERSLERLGSTVIDLYLLHWRGEHPLADTVAAMSQLQRDGKIRMWGVSNFDTEDIQELLALPEGRHCTVNQVYYNLAKRWPEPTLMPCQETAGIVTMAYSPLGQGQLLRNRALLAMAARLGASPAQLAIAWLLHRPGVAAIPKTSRSDGIDEFFGAPDIPLTGPDFDALDAAFPKPSPRARMETT